MEFIDVVRKRRSIRKYKFKKIPRKDIYEIIEIASLAPSGHNRQTWKFLAITNQELLKKMEKAIIDKLDRIEKWPETKGMEKWFERRKKVSTFFVKAPVVFAILTKPYITKMDELLRQHGIRREEIERIRPYIEIQNVSAAIENLILAATNKGYGTCWMCAPLISIDEIHKILKIENPWRLISLVPLGIPDEKIKVKSHKKINELLEFIE